MKDSRQVPRISFVRLQPPGIQLCKWEELRINIDLFKVCCSAEISPEDIARDRVVDESLMALALTARNQRTFRTANARSK